MTKQKPAIDDRETVPHFVYRVNSSIALGVIGLAPTQVAEAIKKGELPPPFDLTETGRARGWYGSQLIEVRNRRLAASAAAAAQRHETAEPKPGKARGKAAAS